MSQTIFVIARGLDFFFKWMAMRFYQRWWKQTIGKKIDVFLINKLLQNASLGEQVQVYSSEGACPLSRNDNSKNSENAFATFIFLQNHSAYICQIGTEHHCVIASRIYSNGGPPRLYESWDKGMIVKYISHLNKHNLFLQKKSVVFRSSRYFSLWRHHFRWRATRSCHRHTGILGSYST